MSGPCLKPQAETLLDNDLFNVVSSDTKTLIVTRQWVMDGHSRCVDCQAFVV